MKAIQTEYNNYKFRSRLEARWAVFFDSLSIDYLYEPEGFGNEVARYLPDFHFQNGLWVDGLDTPLPNIRVEIKPNLDLADAERTKIAEFLKQTDNYILLIGGDPSHKTAMRLLHHVQHLGWQAEFVRWDVLENGQIGLCEVDSAEINPQPPSTAQLTQAFKTARQARFEYGNTKKQRICTECRELFIPYRDHYHTCRNCYTPPVVITPTAPTPKPVSIAPPPKSISTAPAPKSVQVAPTPKPLPPVSTAPPAQATPRPAWAVWLRRLGLVCLLVLAMGVIAVRVYFQTASRCKKGL